MISIHPPLAGRDDASFQFLAYKFYFNPPAPRGARLEGWVALVQSRRFQSTRPSRGETTEDFSVESITVFQSTRPSRGETYPPISKLSGAVISIHPPLAGRDDIE